MNDVQRETLATIIAMLQKLLDDVTAPTSYDDLLRYTDSLRDALRDAENAADDADTAVSAAKNAISEAQSELSSLEEEVESLKRS